jgi:ABC-2 type transport system permease protein
VSKSSRRRARTKARKQRAQPPARVAPAKAPVAPAKAQVVVVVPSTIRAIARRELLGWLGRPIGWAIAAVFLFLASGFGFIGGVISPQQASIDGIYQVVTGVLILVLAPVLALRIGARTGIYRVIVGRWLGAFAFYVLLIATTLVYVVLMAIFARSRALDPGLIAATYIGMLAAGGAAIAIGLFASSVATNRVVAYLLGVGLLVVAWYSTFVVGSLGGSARNDLLDYVSAFNRYQSFSLGQVTLSDAVYFISLTLGALLLAMRLLTTRRSFGVAVTASLLALLIAANVLASRAPQALDFTRDGLNTLTPESASAARSLGSDVQVIGLFRPGTGNGQAEVEALISLYKAQSPHVLYRRENVDTDTTDVKRFAIKEPNTVALDYQGRSQLLMPGSQGEADFTAALLKLESARMPLVCWAIGDGERGLKDTNQATGYSGVADVLRSDSFSTRDLILSESTSIPNDCDELAIIDPTAALPDQSVKAVADYLASGGKLLVAAEPWAKDAQSTQSLNTVLKAYGLTFSGSLVIETDPSRHTSDDPTTLAIPSDTQGRVSFFPQATSIAGTPAAGVGATHVAATTASSYAIAQPRSLQDLGRKAGDAAGPFDVLASIEKPAGAKKTRIVMVGTAGFAENRTLPPNNADANLELALASFQWLAGQDSLVTMGPKAPRAIPLALTQQDQSALIFITTVLLPGLVASVGVVLWRRRRVFS